MSLALIFWILMLLWLVFGVWQNWPNRAAFAGWGGSLLEFLLFLILGWHAFGPPIHG